MKSWSDCYSIVSVAPALAFAVVLGACGGEQSQTHATAPVAAPVQAVEDVGRTNAQPSTPNTPTASSVAISADILRACNISDGDAYFAFDSSALTTFDYGPLDSVATCFSRGPMTGRHLNLVGRADPRGAVEYNMTLGQSRADAVSTYLITRGEKEANVTTTSRGAMDATGRDETGWAHDRRVDVSLAN